MSKQSNDITRMKTQKIKSVKKGQIVNVMYKGIEEFAEVLNVHKYENYWSILTSVFTDNGAVKNTYDLNEILSIKE